MISSTNLYGQGIGFPPHINSHGQLAWSAGELNVRESICIILRTRPGERLMRPDFGCGLDRYLFEPNNISTLRLIQDEVTQALTRWEPRIKLDDVRVATNPSESRAVDITIFYTLIATRQAEKLNMTLTLQA